MKRSETNGDLLNPQIFALFTFNLEGCNEVCSHSPTPPPSSGGEYHPRMSSPQTKLSACRVSGRTCCQSRSAELLPHREARGPSPCPSCSRDHSSPSAAGHKRGHPTPGARNAAGLRLLVLPSLRAGLTEPVGEGSGRLSPRSLCSFFFPLNLPFGVAAEAA